jgi:uncharacterized protein (TIGR00725 family)
MKVFLPKNILRKKKALPVCTPLTSLKYKFCISGSADTKFLNAGAQAEVEELGRLIAERNGIVVTGATTGAPFWAAKGAKMAGGIVIGISPAASKQHHVKSYRLPTDYHDLIIYTGFGYSGRNLFLIRSSDAVITVGGRLGTLNEFTDAFEDHKPQGVLLGEGGTTDMLPEILKVAHRGSGKVVFETEPKALITKLWKIVEDHDQFAHAEPEGND